MKIRIGSIIGDRNKIDMILALSAEGPMKKTDLYAITTNNNLNSRKLDELERDGLIIQRLDKFRNNMTTVSLTDLGRDVAVKLVEIQGMMSGDILTGDDKTDYGSSPEDGSKVR